MVFSSWVHMTEELGVGISSCSVERLLVLKGGEPNGWFWQTHCTAVEIIRTCSQFIFCVDNSTLRSLGFIICFHLIFQEEISHINDTWWRTNNTEIYFRKQHWRPTTSASGSGYTVNLPVPRIATKTDHHQVAAEQGKKDLGQEEKSCKCLCCCRTKSSEWSKTADKWRKGLTHPFIFSLSFESRPE